jgi:hypothetical protein
VLDAGPFIALEHRNATMVALARRFAAASTPLVTSAGVVAQVWRGGGQRQVPVAYLLRRVHVVDLDRGVARLLGRMLGVSGTRDPVDAHVVFLARQRAWPVLTSDVADLRAIDRTLELHKI